MLIFNENSRVEKTKEGLRFYEQDILGCRYIFNDNLIIHLKAIYKTPGLGFVIGDTNSQNIEESNKAILIKIGYNDFQVIEKQYDRVNILYEASHSLKPNNKEIHLIFSINKKTVKIEWILSEKRNIILGEFDLPYMLSEYLVGLYSNSGNILRETKINQQVPERWDYQLSNSRGGRIKFKDRYFIFENGDHDFELEQSRIPLKAGKYYLKYKKEDIDEKNNIEVFVFLYDSLKKDNEHTTHDEPKNLLNKDNSFTIDEDTFVSLKFRGESGKISDIIITDIEDGNFIPTTDKQISTEGSSIEFLLNNIKKISWNMTIDHVPRYDDLTKEPPYSIVGKTEKNILQNLFINTKKEYTYEYIVSSKKLTIKETDTDKKIITKYVNPEKDKKLIIAFNITANISNINLEMNDNKNKNILADSQFNVYVNSSVKSPIIITNEDKTNSFDISASYREHAKEELRYKIFKNEQQIIVPGNLPDNSYSVKIYGVSSSLDIFKGTKENILKLKNTSTELSDEMFKKKNNIISISKEQKEIYNYFILEYTDVSNYKYIFTNTEREIIPNDELVFVLEKEILKNSNIKMYGIKKGSYINKEYLYRVPAGIEDSIGLYANEYERISSNNYVINYDTSTITLLMENNEEKYEELIIDYKKKDSYSINYNKNTDMYEISISTNNRNVMVHYDSHEDGHINSFINTEIKPVGNQYIILKEENE